MKKIRRGMFETNSSMTHALCMVTDDDYQRFKDGEMVYDRYNEELVEAKDDDDEDDDRYWNFENFGGDCEFGSMDFTTPHGDTVVALYYYGWD